VFAPSKQLFSVSYVYCTCASSFYSALILPSRFSRPGDTCPSDGESARSNERGPSVSCNFHRVGGYPLFRITGSLREVRSCRSCGSSGTIEARIKDARIRAIYVQISRHTTIDITCFPIFFSPQYRRKTLTRFIYKLKQPRF